MIPLRQFLFRCAILFLSKSSAENVLSEASYFFFSLLVLIKCLKIVEYFADIGEFSFVFEI